MPFPTQSVTKVTANQTSAVLAQLVTAMNAGSLPLDPSIMNLLGVTMTSDLTASVGATSVRTLTVALNVPPLLTSAQYNVAATAGNGTFSVFSTSPQDSGPIGGASTGAQTIQFTFADAVTGTVTLNGTTPVAFNNANHGIITGYTFPNLGTFGANKGMIVVVGPALVGQNNTKAILDVRQTLGPKGAPATNATPRNFTPVVATIPASFYTIYPTTGQQAAPFLHWIYNQEQQAVGGIIYTNPVLT